MHEWKTLKTWTSENAEKLSLAVVCTIIFLLACVRSIYSSMTGFILPDEGLYFHATVGNFYIRPVFVYLLTLYKKVLGITNISGMLNFGAFFGALFSIGAVLALYKIWKNVSTNKDARVYSILSMIMLPMFLILSPTWLTEAPSFCISMFAILSMTQFLKSNSHRYLVGSLALFTLASFIRESAWILLIGSTLILIYFRIRKVKGVSFLIIVGFLLATMVTTPYIALEQFGIPKVFVWQFPMLAEQSSTYVPIFGITPEVHQVQPLDAAVKFLVASSLAYGLIFVLTIIGMVSALKAVAKDNMLMFLLASSVLGYVAFILFCVRLSEYSLVYTSTTVRFAYASYSSLLLLPRAYSALKPKFRKIFFFLTLSFLVVTALVGLPILQSGLSTAGVNVYFSNGYQTPYFRAYNLVSKNSRVLIFAEPYVRISLFFLNNPNVTIYSFAINGTKDYAEDASIFDQVIHYGYWGTVLVYGEFYQNYYVSLNQNSPFFMDLIQNKTSYNLKTIWSDSESYLLEVIVK